jgi:PhnB protein
MALEAYLFFNGRCDEAIAFYQSALGAEVQMLMRFRENPDPPPPGSLPPDSDDKVMHASLRIGGSTLMVSDGMAFGDTAFRGFSLSHSVPDSAAAQQAFAALADGGQVTMPIGRTFWSPCFGMVTDRFGVSWMVTTVG